jgi:sigma-B regulation protein RsbU (phosphoserine phosphatase)
MTKARILVVDDEPAILRTVERVLGERYLVAGARGAAEALVLFESFDPDLAILDVRMPEIDGFELTARLKAARTDLDVILMTGSINELDARLIRAIREKAFYFIQKPFDREVLHTLVGRCLELRSLERENKRHLARLERELASARAFQQSLLPPETGRAGRIAVAARYAPCEELGGDVFDYAAGGRHRGAVLIADVSGHGVSAAMLTGIVKSAFRAASVEEFDPLEVVQRISSGVRPFGYERFVTVIAARMAGDRTLLEYVNAGHPPALLWGKRREPALLHSTGPMISPAWPNPSWTKQSIPLDADDPAPLHRWGDGDPRRAGPLRDRAAPVGGAARPAGRAGAARRRALRSAGVLFRTPLSGRRDAPDDRTRLIVTRTLEARAPGRVVDDTRSAIYVEEGRRSESRRKIALRPLRASARLRNGTTRSRPGGRSEEDRCPR